MKTVHFVRGAAVSLLCFGVLSLPPLPVAAQDVAFPSQVTIVVPYPPASSNDTFARLLAEKLRPQLNTAIIVENRPGASGAIGSNYVAKAAPNGATFLLTSSSLTTGAAIDPNLPFDPINDLVPVAQLAKGPLIVATAPNTPYKTLSELLAAARADKGAINFGTSGVGSLSQLANELLNSMAKVEMTHIPYKGISEAITDTMAGRVQMVIASFPAVAAQMKAGSVRGLAVTSKEKSSFAPALPTVAETLPGFEAEIWWGVFAPAGTPKPMIDKLNAEIRKIIDQPDMRARFAQEGAVPGPMSADEFAALVKADLNRWRTVAQERGIKPE